MNTMRTFLRLSLAVAVAAMVPIMLVGCGAGKEKASSLTPEPTVAPTASQQAASLSDEFAAVPATPSQTPEEDIDKIITDFVMDLSGPNTQSVGIDSKSYYTDSSAGTWIKFTASVIREVAAEGPFSGIITKARGGEWQLINLEMGSMECDIPVDVQSGLGLTVCPTTYGQDIDAEIRRLVPEPTDSDISIYYKHFYTDSSGTEWVRFQVLPMPKGIGDPRRGIMTRPAGGGWELLAFGSGGEECGLPADVQTGLGYTVICNQPV